MKKFNKIYYVTVAVLAILLVVCSFLNVTMGSFVSNVNVADVKTYATSIGDAGRYDAFDDSHAMGNIGDRGNVVSAITKSLKIAISNRYSALYANGQSSNISLSDSAYGSSRGGFVRGEYQVTDEYGVADSRYELAPIYYSTTANVQASDIARMPNIENGEIYTGKVVQNIVLYLPGTDTMKATSFNNIDIVVDKDKLGDAVVLTAHFDTTVGNAGYVNNGISCGALLGYFDYLMANNIRFKNDLVFVFADGGNQSNFGLNAFMYASSYASLYENVQSRVKAVVNFDCIANNGVMVMGKVSNGGADVLHAYSTNGNFSYSSALVGDIYATANGINNFGVLDAIPALNFITSGSLDAVSNAQDINDATVQQVCAMVEQCAKTLGNADVANYTNSTPVSMFSYLDLNFYYANWLSYVFGAILVILLALTIALIVVKKVFDYKPVIKGIAVSALSIISSVAGLFLLYVLIALTFGLCGIVSLSAMFTMSTSNMILFAGMLVLGIVLSVVFNNVYSKALGVSADDVVKGNSLIIALFAIVTSFVFPQYAYVFGPLAFLQIASMFVSAIFSYKVANADGEEKEKFVAKSVFVNGLYLLSVLSVVLLPIVLCDFALISTFTATCFMPLQVGVVLVYLQSVIPYSAKIYAYAKSVMPEKKKKSKKKKAQIVARPISHKILLAILPVAVVVYVVAVLSGVLGIGYVQNAYNGYDGIYNNAIVYRCETNANGDISQYMEIKDGDLYSRWQKYLGDFKWNGNAFVLEDYNTPESELKVPTTSPYKVVTNANGDDVTSLYRFTNRLFVDSMIEIKVSVIGEGSLNKVRVSHALSSTQYTTQNMSSGSYTEIVSADGKTLTVRIPVGYGTPTSSLNNLAIEYYTSTANESGKVKLAVDYSEYVTCGNVINTSNIGNLGNYNDVIATIQAECSSQPDINDFYINYVYSYANEIEVNEIG